MPQRRDGHGDQREQQHHANASTWASLLFSSPSTRSTNKIYVSNDCGNDINCASLGTVTVIDGATLNTTTVNVGAYPEDIEVNPATNQIYVANNCGSDVSCNSPGTATVINANNNYSTATVNVGYHPYFLDIDTVANKIYVANTCGNDPNCASPGTVTVIDGATNSTFPIAVGDEPDALAVNSSTHTIYVPNFLDNTVSVIGGNTKLQLVNVTPCRLVDTRSNGGGPIEGGASRELRHSPTRWLQHSHNGGSLFLERHSGAAQRRHAGLFDHLAHVRDTARGFHAELTGRPGQGQRGHRAGRRQRRGQRVCQRHHQRHP